VNRFIGRLLLETTNQHNPLTCFHSTRSSQSAVTSLRNSSQQWLFLYNVSTIRFLATDFNIGTKQPHSTYRCTTAHKVFSSQTGLHVSTNLHLIILVPQLPRFQAHILEGCRSKLDWLRTTFVVLYNPSAPTTQKTHPLPSNGYPLLLTRRVYRVVVLQWTSLRCFSDCTLPAFRRQVTILTISVRPHLVTREPLIWFLWNMVCENFAKICWDIPNLVKIGQQ
jgi:hypothetical protein